jgi:hypothetical protein
MSHKSVFIKRILYLILLISMLLGYSCSQGMCPSYSGRSLKEIPRLPKEL